MKQRAIGTNGMSMKKQTISVAHCHGCCCLIRGEKTNGTERRWMEDQFHTQVGWSNPGIAIWHPMPQIRPWLLSYYLQIKKKDNENKKWVSMCSYFISWTAISGICWKSKKPLPIYLSGELCENPAAIPSITPSHLNSCVLMDFELIRITWKYTLQSSNGDPQSQLLYVYNIQVQLYSWMTIQSPLNLTELHKLLTQTWSQIRTVIFIAVSLIWAGT